MAGKVAGVLAKKVLKESAENKFGQEDPYFETVTATNLRGQQTTKKRKRAVPEGLSPHDAKVLTKVKRRAYRLDLCLCSFFGIRFGWGSLIALVPAIGDALDMALALMVVASCNKVEGGLPGNIRLHMLFNVILDFALGLVPFVGDLVDAAYKCNSRNAILLEKYLKTQAQRNLESGGQPMTELEPSTARDDGGSRSPSRPATSNTPPTEPEPARLPAGDAHPSRGDTRQPRGNHQQSRGNTHQSSGKPGRKKRQPDLEMGG